MNLKIRDIKEPNTLELYLEKDEETGGVELMAEDANGDTWFILRIQPNGTIFLHAGIEESSGLGLDKNTCIVVSEEYDA